MNKNELEKLKKFFETTFKNYLGDHNYKESQKDFQVFKTYYDGLKEKKVFTEYQQRLIDGFCFQFELQFVNIFKQCSGIQGLFDILIKLSEKPDDKESINKLTEYAMALGFEKKKEKN